MSLGGARPACSRVGSPLVAGRGFRDGKACGSSTFTRKRQPATATNMQCKTKVSREQAVCTPLPVQFTGGQCIYNTL